jgi:cell division transport system permease protein
MKAKAVATAWQRIRRAPYQTLAAVSIMTMTLFLAGTFILTAAGSQAVLRFFESRPQVDAYFRTDYVPTPAEVDTARSRLSETGLVASFKYISKSDALVIYKDLNKSDPLLLEAVTADMLPASLEVSASDPKNLKSLSQAMKQIPNIEDVRYAEDIISSLEAWTNSVRTVGLVLVGAHIFITLVTILLVISIKVANRRDEITILGLVGATPGYIASPFIWEGVIYGVIGAILAWMTTFFLWVSSRNFLGQLFSGIPDLPLPLSFMFQLLGAELAIGTLVGSIGAILAARRFLKA